MDKDKTKIKENANTFNSQRYRERLEAAGNYNERTQKPEQSQNPFEEMSNKAEAYKIKGNQCYKDGDYTSALNFYNLAIVRSVSPSGLGPEQPGSVYQQDDGIEAGGSLGRHLT